MEERLTIKAGSDQGDQVGAAAGFLRGGVDAVFDAGRVEEVFAQVRDVFEEGDLVAQGDVIE